ncbi:MAG: lipocalin family protein, partial [Vibrio sp.]
VCAALITGCTGTPKGIEPISNFSADDFYGTWHEVARLDHSFEENLTLVTASYQALPNQEISVTNRGFNTEEKEWEQASGKAKFVEDPTTGHLKVSFFGPFYSSYVVFYLEDDVALVTSYNKDYLWILSKDHQLNDADVTKYVDIAKQAGFDTDKLIFDQDDKYELEGRQALYQYEEDADRVTPLSEDDYESAEMHIMPAPGAAKIN